MGSKNLKAITMEGDSKLKYANKDGFSEYVKKVNEAFRKNVFLTVRND
jgi:aldehyde:ferredoxin oxidoreductase